MIGSPLQSFGERALTGAGLLVLALVLGILWILARRERGRLTPDQRAWRRVNALTVGILALLAIDLLPDLPDETELAHRADELVVMGLALLAVGWYVSRTAGRLGRSTTPLALGALALLAKAVAIAVEFKDKPDVQGDIAISAIGLPVLLGLAWLWVRTGRRNSGGAPGTG